VQGYGQSIDDWRNWKPTKCLFISWAKSRDNKLGQKALKRAASCQFEVLGKQGHREVIKAKQDQK